MQVFVVENKFFCKRETRYVQLSCKVNEFRDKMQKKIIFQSIYLCIWIIFCNFAHRICKSN